MAQCCLCSPHRAAAGCGYQMRYEPSSHVPECSIYKLFVRAAWRGASPVQSLATGSQTFRSFISLMNICTSLVQDFLHSFLNLLRCPKFCLIQISSSRATTPERLCKNWRPWVWVSPHARKPYLQDQVICYYHDLRPQLIIFWEILYIQIKPVLCLVLDSFAPLGFIR